MDTTVTSQKDVAITYEKLYELMRREKMKEELQPLDPLFFSQLLAYLAEKDVSYKDSIMKNDVFSINERQRLQTELHNIHRLVKELYDKREKKIIDMALNRSRTSAAIVDTTHLLNEERALYEQLNGVMETFRKGVLDSLLMLKSPLLSQQAVFPTLTSQQSIADKPPIPSNQKMLRFLQSVPQIVGTEMETYGPFEPNQTAVIPTEIADIWIEQGAAVETT